VETVVRRFGEAIEWIDRSGEPFRGFQPGVGPYGEPQLVKKLASYLRERYPGEFKGAVTKREPDLLIPGSWAFEFKIVRPFGDNGLPAEHWSQNLVHPYDDNTSAIGDALKLQRLRMVGRKGVVVFTYSHMPPRIQLEPLVRCFELIATEIAGVKLGRRCEAAIHGLIHPVHQQATVYGWEVLQG
jgi:hypothetical protein